MVSDEVKNNTSSLVQKVCPNSFNQDEVNVLTKRIISDISLNDALKFKDIDPRKTPVMLNSAQKLVLDGLMNKLKGDALGNKADSEYQKAMRRGIVKVK